MKFRRQVPFLVVTFVQACTLLTAQAQNQIQPEKQESTDNEAAQPKLIKSPLAPYPEEALKKGVEGKVVLSIVVDATGQVSDANPVSGPPELFQAAIDSVKQWQFEPPLHPPVVTKAEVHYGYMKECPAPVSDHGQVQASGRLKSQGGTVVDAIEDDDWLLPPYFAKDRKAGVAGDMVLSLTVNAKGKTTKVRVVKSLSPDLDKAAIKTVRKWRFKLKTGSPGGLPDVFPVNIKFQPACSPKF